MAGPQIFAKVAVLGVGALLGTSGGVTLLAGITWPLGELVDALFHGLDGARRRSLRTLCGCLADDLDRLLPGDSGMREAARLRAEELAGRFGLSDRELAELDLHPGDAAEAVLRHAAFTRDEAVELRPHVRRILGCFYERLTAQPELLADLLPHVHRATLRRLRRIEDEQQRQTALLRQIAAAVAAAERVPNEVLQEILSRFGEAGTAADPAVIEQRLRAKAEEYRGLESRLRRLSNDDPDVQRLRREAADLIGAADFPGADARLAEAEALDLAAVKELDALLRRRRTSAAGSRAERGAAARLASDYRISAGHYAAAAEIVGAAEPELRWRYRLDQAESLRRLGDERGDNPALVEAIEVLRQATEWAPRASRPLDWATTRNNLGNALRTLGQREPGTARLEEAVAAYRDALPERTRERVPLDWAQTRHNLGTALWTLGQREPGTARLEEAVAAYRDALLERTRERVPLDWAMTQNNLGTALQTQGEREPGTARLEEAVAAFRDALLERTRERVPLNWATTQNNLGNALRTLGGREAGTARLEEAIAAYRDALLEYTRERVPLNWAVTQNNLGEALQALGERASSIGPLEQAVAAYRDALLELTREQVPLYWATIQHNLGKALLVLAEWSRQPILLDEASDALTDARSVFVLEAKQDHRAAHFDEKLAEVEAARRRLATG